MKAKPRFPWMGNILGKFSPQKRHSLLAGTIFFIIGSIFSFGFNSLAVIGDLNAASFWGDYQNALAFDRSQPTLANLVNLRCPILLSPDQEGTIQSTFHNPHREKVEILVSALVSQRDFRAYREIHNTLSIEPHARQIFSWNISRRDVIAGNLILSRVFLMNQEEFTAYPARTHACGVFVWRLFGFKGSTVVAFMATVSLLGLLLGCISLYAHQTTLNRPISQRGFSLFLFAATCALCVVASLLGWWVFAGLMLLFDALLGSSILSSFLFQSP